MNNMSDLLLLPDLKTIEPPQENGFCCKVKKYS